MARVYSIKDMAVEAGLSYDTVYWYIRQGLIRESGVVGNNQRVFTNKELKRLKKIAALRREGRSIFEIREAIGGAT